MSNDQMAVIFCLLMAIWVMQVVKLSKEGPARKAAGIVSLLLAALGVFHFAISVL